MNKFNLTDIINLISRCPKTAEYTLVFQTHMEYKIDCKTDVCVRLVAQLCLTLCDHMDYSLPGSSVHGDSSGENTGVGCHALLEKIFPPRN